MKLFRRFIQAKIIVDNKELVINDEKNNDIKISFSIEKNKYKAPNQATIEIYNLNEDTRNQLNKKDIIIILNAGYEDNYETMYKGYITNIWHKNSDLDWITSLNAAENQLNIQNSFSSFSAKKDQSLNDIIKSFAGDMDLEFLGLDENLKIQLSQSFTGQSSELLEQFLKDYDLEYHVTDDKINIFSKAAKRKEAIVLNGSNILKNNGVVKTDLGVDIKTMLIPTIKAGDTIYLDTAQLSDIKAKNTQFIKQDTSLESVNGYYIVSSAKFAGDNYNGEFTTTLECLRGR